MYKKKLIETSIPLDEINAQAVREKSIRKGHPSTLHLWWARRPLAAARCVIFASMVDDPSEHPELFPTEEEQNAERERLHDMIRKLADWSNIGDEKLYADAYAEMIKYAPDDKLPEFLDPFAGGGALPLEAQCLGLVSHAADLNPIPVTLNRAMIDIPARFCGQKPVHPGATMNQQVDWPRATGLAEDVRYYANKMRDMAKERIGQNYPDIEVASGGTTRMATPIAYIWARTVTCPNPACRCETPLVRSFWLSKKKRHRAYIDPIVHDGDIDFEVRFEGNGWKDFSHVENETVGRKGGRCLHCGGPLSLDYIRAEGREHGLGTRLIAIVCENPFGRGRWYVSADAESSNLAEGITVSSYGPASALIAKNPRDFKTPNYGLTKFSDLFTARQFVTLSTLSELIDEVSGIVEEDAIQSGMGHGGQGLASGGNGSKAYAEAIAVYLAFSVDKLSDYCSTICTWHSGRELLRNVFSRQAIPMAWDFAEVNALSESAGSYSSMAGQIVEAIRTLPAGPKGDVTQRDAAQTEGVNNLLISTDPPYYDNIGYSDLSDYFYVWMRRSLRRIYPSTFGTMLTPKREELVATPYRFEGGADEAKEFFESGMREAFSRLARAGSGDYPITVYYAYKQSEATDDGRTSSGWETMLQALMDAGLQITGTWPMRTEMSNRTIASCSNALASSIVLVCRKREEGAPIATRPEFQRELRRMLRRGVEDLQNGSIAPVDMAQASIGPGMAAFSKYSQVLESDGTPMSVHTALGIINEQLDTLMGESGESFDNETRFCITWYEQFGFEKGDFGTAETLRNARSASFGELVHSGALVNDGGKTWLVNPAQVAAPNQTRIFNSVWSDLMTAITALETGGIDSAAKFVSGLNMGKADHAKSLAYILFQAAERGSRTEDAAMLNGLVTSWADISERAEALKREQPVQYQLDFNA